jgi:IS30 family transposase
MQKKITAAMRGVIEGLLHKNCNIKQIAKKIGVHRNIVSREIKLRFIKNGYGVQIVQWDYQRKRKKLNNSRLHRKVVEK